MAECTTLKQVGVLDSALGTSGKKYPAIFPRTLLGERFAGSAANALRLILAKDLCITGGNGRASNPAADRAVTRLAASGEKR